MPTDPLFPTDAPRRAHAIVLTAGGDTEGDLARELYRMAEMIERGELTAGCSGSPSGGAIYSYKRDPAMTHDAYFEAVEAWLRKRGAGGNDA